MIAAASVGPSAYWYLTRGTGTIALVLLTLSVALGVANVNRLRAPGVPRFVLDAVHRNASLLAMVFLVLHIVTSLLDGFAPIRVIDTVIPFASQYRPVWLGLGAVAFDLMIAVLVTSLLRRRLGHRAWRLTHWAAYACWPLALLHGLGTGSDTRAGWMLVIVGGCVIVMIVALVARATAGWPTHLGARLSALGASALVPLGLLIWLPSGPLAAGWAKRAGTPAALLASASRTATGSSQSASRAASGSSSTPIHGFSAHASGTVRQGPAAGGLQGVDITLALSGQTLSELDIRLQGEPLQGGGIQMTTSAVTLGTSANPTEYRGQVTALEGTTIRARLQAAHGAALTMLAQLQIDPRSGAASGTVSVSP